MWDNPRALNALADALFVAAGLFVGYLAVIAVINSPYFGLRVVSVAGDVRHLDADRLAAELSRRVTGNFFGASLETVRATVESQPWVRRAEVSRAWPDRLVVRIEEHAPLARWSGSRLVNTYGELFEGEVEVPLPQLGGPPGSEAEVARRYAQFREILAPLDVALVQVIQSHRRAWQLKLANGLVLELGRDQAKSPVDARLARFVDVYPRTVARLNRRLDYVDLRYPNGFALRVPEIVDTERRAKAGSA